jgi:adenylate kinase
MNDVIAVIGLSGVGKGWLISRFAKEHTAHHVEASRLLKEAKKATSGAHVTSEELRTGAVINNQDLLISAFLAEREKTSGLILFDGHCIVDSGAELVEIPVDVFKAISPSGIILICSEPATIADRRAGDTARTRPARSAAELHQHQERTRTICTSYAEFLGIGLHTVEAGDETAFTSAVSTILSRDAP